MSRLSLVIGDKRRLLKIAELTNARVGLENHGAGLSTRDSLAFLLDHARARDAVEAEVDQDALRQQVTATGAAIAELSSQAPDRTTYLRRPDLGRRLDEASRARLAGFSSGCDAAIVLADGLSARALEKHGPVVLRGLLDRLAAAGRTVGPVATVRNGRVAIGDEIGEILKAKLVIVLIGERPGLSSPDSLGVYLTFDPRPGRTDAERNCVSNVRPAGMGFEEAARRVDWLAAEALRRGATGVALKDESDGALAAAAGRPRLGG